MYKVGRMRALLIANPNSTTQDPALFRRVIPVLSKVEGLELRAQFTHAPGHATEMCTGLSRDDFDVVIAVGGDGTVNEVVNGLLGSVHAPTDPDTAPRLAVIPTGSANVFARALGFPADPQLAAEALAHTLANEHTRLVELGTWDDSWFAVNAGFGIDADVIEGVERVRNRGFAATPLRYMRVALRAWRRMHRNPPHLELRASNSAGEEIHEADLPLLIASNTNPWTFLGPLPVITNPRNSFDQGLGLYGLRTISGPRGVAGMAHLVGFGHSKRTLRWLEKFTFRFDDANQVHLRCHEERGFQVDGEYIGQLEEVTLKAVPQAIEVYAPVESIPATPMSTLRVALSFLSIRI